MLPRLINKDFIKSISIRHFKEAPIAINKEAIIFDNDFFIMIIVLILISMFVTFVIYTRLKKKRGINKKKSKKLFRVIINYYNFLEKTEHLKNLNHNN